jgi:hypothetical protein
MSKLYSLIFSEKSHEIVEVMSMNMKIMIQVKGKAIPLQAWGGPEGCMKLRFPDFTTKAQDGGKVVSLMHLPPLPQEIHLVLISVRG